MLKPVEFKKNLEYTIEKNSRTFIVGVRNAHFSREDVNIRGSLYLDKIVTQKPIKVWRPKLKNPFARKDKLKNIIKKELYLKNFPMGGFMQGLGFFVERINQAVCDKYDSFIYPADAKLLFEGVYDYYGPIAWDLRKRVFKLGGE